MKVHNRTPFGYHLVCTRDIWYKLWVCNIFCGKVNGKTRNLQDGQEDSGPAVIGRVIVKVMVCGDFSRQANGDTFSCRNSSHIGSRNLFPSSDYTKFPVLDYEPITHISESVRPFVHWKFSVHLSERHILLDTVALYNRLCRENWEI